MSQAPTSPKMYNLVCDTTGDELLFWTEEAARKYAKKQLQMVGLKEEDWGKFYVLYWIEVYE